MKVAPQHFWVGSGCDQRINYDYSANRDGCAEMQTFTRNFLPGYMEERRAIQKICLCTGTLCNRATKSSNNLFKKTLIFLLIILILS